MYRSSVPRKKFIEKCREYISTPTPFAIRGRSKEGLDCVGLVIVVSKELKLIDEDYEFTEYRKKNKPETLIREMNKFLVPIPQRNLNDIEGGSILCFSLPKYPCHVGIYLGDGKIIHSLIGKGVVEEEICCKWEKYLFAVYKFPMLL